MYDAIQCHDVITIIIMIQYHTNRNHNILYIDNHTYQDKVFLASLISEGSLMFQIKVTWIMTVGQDSIIRKLKPASNYLKMAYTCSSIKITKITFCIRSYLYLHNHSDINCTSPTRYEEHSRYLKLPLWFIYMYMVQSMQVWIGK